MTDLMDGLVWDFRKRLEGLLKDLKARGVEMRVISGVRTPLEQAKLWRQSRGRAEIEAALLHLRGSGGYFLADVLEAAGPCEGACVTRALPGLSWHQWGEAADCVWMLNGRAEWSVERMSAAGNGYRVYAEEAELACLTAGGNWNLAKDWPHVQKRKAPSPLAAGMSLIDIDRTMRQRFS